MALWAKSRRYTVFAMVVLLMIGLQYVLIRADVAAVRDLHPVNGVVMILVAHAAVRRIPQ